MFDFQQAIGTPAFWLFGIAAAAVLTLFGFHFGFKGSVQFT